MPAAGRCVVPRHPFPAPPGILFLTVNRAEQSAAELAESIVREAQDLVRLEIDLAVQEVKELAIRNAWAAGLMAVGALLLTVAVLVALPVLLVVLWDRHVLGAAIYLGVLLVLGAAAALVGWRLLRLEPPRRTLTSLKETKQWALRQIR